jgi:hypothetical protein
MKKNIPLLVFALMLWSGIIAQAQNGKMFPEITGTTLEDKTVSLPKDTKGKYTLVGVAYSQKADDALKGWFQPVYETFLDESDYDVNVYFIGMISGIKEVAAGTIEKKMKQGVDPVLHKNMLLYKGEAAKYKDLLGLKEKDTPYFFLIDKTGKVVYTTSGAYTDAKLEKAEDILDENAE